MELYFGYTRGIVVIAFADAVLVFIGLLILQVPLAPALAAVVFLGAFIPVVGAPSPHFLRRWSLSPNVAHLSRS